MSINSHTFILILYSLRLNLHCHRFLQLLWCILCRNNCVHFVGHDLILNSRPLFRVIVVGLPLWLLIVRIRRSFVWSLVVRLIVVTLVIGELETTVVGSPSGQLVELRLQIAEPRLQLLFAIHLPDYIFGERLEREENAN